MALNFPVAQALFHPPYGACQRELITGLFSGSGILQRATGALPPFNNVNAYGLRWAFFTIPSEFGLTLGEPIVYQPRMIQLAARYRDAVGNEDDLEVVDVHAEMVWFWKEPGPFLIHYEIAPGVQVVFEWMIVKFP